MATGLKLRIEEVEGLYYLCSESKSADQVTAQLICPFVFAYAKRRFSYGAAHIYSFALTTAMIDIFEQLNSLVTETTGRYSKLSNCQTKVFLSDG